MAQTIPCDLCENEPAALIATWIENGDTLGVGSGCIAAWCQSMMDAVTATAEHAPSEPAEAPEPAETSEPATQDAPEPEPEADPPPPVAAFPGTSKVVKSTHGHRKPRNAPREAADGPSATANPA